MPILQLHFVGYEFHNLNCSGRGYAHRSGRIEYFVVHPPSRLSLRALA
jgi:hypothetical protein